MPSPYYLIKLDNGYAEGYIEVNGCELYWKSFGRAEKGTILTLHGGPGSSHNNVIDFAKLSEYGYRVVFYDQLGGGASEKPGDMTLYTMDRFVEDAEGVRRNLNLGKVHLYGASWGGFLAPAYAVKYWRNLKSLMIQSGTCSMPLFVSEINRLRSKLPKRIRDTLKKYEALGDYKNPEYSAAMAYVYGRHAWRFDPSKHPQIRLWLQKGAGEYPYFVYRIMMGINDFYGTGNLWHWDVTDQLPNIKVPTLITVGEYDEVTPRNSEALHKGIKGSKLVVFKGCSHHLFLEAPEKFIKVHREFMDSIE